MVSSVLDQDDKELLERFRKSDLNSEDPVLNAIYGESPPIEFVEPVQESSGHLRVPSSTDGDLGGGMVREDSTKSIDSLKPAKKQTRNVVFEDQTEADEVEYDFEKTEVGARVFPKTSFLTLALGGKPVTIQAEPEPEEELPMRGGYAARRRARQRGAGGGAASNQVKMTVFVPKSDDPDTPLKVTVLDAATVTQALDAIIKKYADEGREPALEYTDNAAYILRCAEDDGEIDDDIPVLGAEQQIKNFKFADAFAVLPNEAYEPPPPEPEKPEVAAGAGGNPNLRRSSRGTLLFKVMLPGKITHMMACSSDLTLKDVFLRVCRRKNLFPDGHCFVPIFPRKRAPSKGTGGESGSTTPHGSTAGSAPVAGLSATPVPQPGSLGAASGAPTSHTAADEDDGNADEALNLGMPVTAAPSSELRILRREQLAIRKRNYADAPQRAENKKETEGEVPDPSQFYFTDATAEQYKEYEVIKINDKRGKRERRIMGIDGEKIHNKLPELIGSYRPAKRAKKPFHYIETVTQCKVLECRPGYTPTFTIVYKEMLKESSYHFETVNNDPNEACEIVAKIQYLQQRARKVSATQKARAQQKTQEKVKRKRAFSFRS